MAWERLRRKCRSRIFSPCSRTIPARCCPRLPGIAHDCPLKKCRKPWWPRNTAVDLAALDVSRAPLRDSPAARLSQRIMNQGLSWRAAQAGANSEVFTRHETRNTALFAVDAQGTHNQKPPPGTPCTPPGRCFPARCGAAWGGYGAAWAAWGAPSRCPRTVRTSNRAFRVFTKHEIRITAFFECLRPSGGEKCSLSASVGRSAGFKGECTKRCVNEWKEVYPNPERKITTFSESGFGSRFGIPHYSSEFVGKIRISPCRPSSASAHAARWLLSCALWRGMGRLWRGMGGILPLSSVPAPDRRSRWQPVVKPRVAPRAACIAPRAALRPADKERRGSILDIFDRGATQFRRDASPLNLHVSPRGEAKCVRGPSGLGASRAEEKGASRLARAGVLEQYVEHGKQAQRSPGARIACFDRRVVRNAG